jgi:RNA polymerase sigma-70 factor (ECF subfamily)
VTALAHTVYTAREQMRLWIIARVRENEFESLYAEHAEPLLAFLASRTGDRRLAEDLTADTFERVLRKRSVLDVRKGSAKTWIYTIALNLLRDHLRREQAHQRSVERSGRVDGPLSPLEFVGTRDAVRRALETLGDDEREAIALRFAADLTFPEIAKILRCPVSTVEGRTHRALRKLKEVLDDAEGPSEAHEASGREVRADGQRRG